MSSDVSSVVRCELPDGALLARYARTGAYTDCYATDVARAVSHAEFVEAFYTGAVFKAERLLLAWIVAKPSTDAQAAELAHGTRDDFAAWRVEARATDQLLACDVAGRTRSWLMTLARDRDRSPSTRLYFGSAVVPAAGQASGRLGFPYDTLLGFHRLYSRVLLREAAHRLARTPVADPLARSSDG